jgi:outer membrane biosynthesis protein TonB
MDISLRGAFIISAIIHAGVFAPFYNQHLLRQELEKKNTIVVDYIVLKEIAAAIATNKEVVLKRPETLRIDVQKEVAVTPQPALQVKADNRKSAKSDKLKERTKSRKRDAVKDSSKEAARKEVRLRQDKDYVNYYQLIREKIRSRLKDNYRYYNREGDVYLSFTLTPNGSLLSYSIDKSRSTQDDILLQITGNSLKAVSPFPSLPRSLTASKMSFSIAISFRK